MKFTEASLETAFNELLGHSVSDLYESNKTFKRMLLDGFILKREYRSQKDIYIQLTLGQSPFLRR